MLFLPNVVVATTKVRIFKQITTGKRNHERCCGLLLLPQRYVFSSKSQHDPTSWLEEQGCCCYHKGTYFQANHNTLLYDPPFLQVVVATTKVRIFKQITTEEPWAVLVIGCCCYHKGTYFQANHNSLPALKRYVELLLLPQRYVFSSKSQLNSLKMVFLTVVVATTKVRIFKQITTLPL